MADLFHKFAALAESRDRLLAGGEDPFAVCMEKILSQTRAVIGGRETILVGTNNYLGLSFAPQCIEAAKRSLDAEGTGTTGSRVANGTYAGHRRLERRIARLFERERALVFSTGYQANMGVLSALGGPKDYILIDADSHACIYDGARLSGATVLRFRHNDADDLDKRLSRLERTPETGVLIVAEGVYSMRGDRAPIDEFVAVKRRHDAYLMLDEAHSFGVFGRGGRGVADASGLGAEVDFIVGTFSKSLGTVGGFCVSDHPGLDLLRYASRPYVFTASLPPAIVASATTALDLLEEGDALRDRLWRNVRHLHDGLRILGFEISAPESPIIAVRLPSMEHVIRFWNALLREGVYVNPAVPPGTPQGVYLLRCSVCADHDKAQLDRVCAAFASIGRDLSLIP